MRFKMTRQVSLFHRSASDSPRKSTLFAPCSTRDTPRADENRSADTLKVAAALGAAQARMERLFASA
jgi:hypothetical protein